MPREARAARKAGFTLRTQIYGAYEDHFAHLGRVFSATNADLRRRDRRVQTLLQYAVFYAWMLDGHWLIARNLCVYASFYATFKINPSPWNGTQPILRRCLRIRAEIYAWSVNVPTRARCVDSFAHFGCVRTAYRV